MIEAAQVMERDADLEHPLIQTPYLAAFDPPEQLDRLVLLEVFATIELRNSLEQLPRRRFPAPVIHAGMLS